MKNADEGKKMLGILKPVDIVQCKESFNEQSKEKTLPSQSQILNQAEKKVIRKGSRQREEKGEMVEKWWSWWKNGY